jgi:hypothetical protein
MKPRPKATAEEDRANSAKRPLLSGFREVKIPLLQAVSVDQSKKSNQVRVAVNERGVSCLNHERAKQHNHK